MPKIHELQICLSGGAANSNPALSIGGARGNQIAFDTIDDAAVLALPGVTWDYAFGNSSGQGLLDYENLGGGEYRFKWTTFGDGPGEWLTVSADGQYTLLSANGAGIVITVTTASLGSNDYRTLDVYPVANTLFDDISKGESYAGETDYRCIYLYNSSAEAFNYVEFYISAQPTGADSLEIGIDPNGVNDGANPAATVANENTAPSSVTFDTHTGEVNAVNIGDLQPGEMVAIWIKRTVPASTLVGSANDLSLFGIKALV